MRAMAVTSPPELGPAVFRRVIGRSVADIGCGSGVFGFMLRSAWHYTGSWIDEAISAPDRLIGVDFSPVALESIKRRHVYDEALLSDAASLPLEDDAVDTAISMENLEHLFPREVPNALGELVRIAAQRVVISTPAPWRVIHGPWVRRELDQVADDHGSTP
jgi:ubiquinone/menaquinone biosynthesis C-methylase UbiE